MANLDSGIRCTVPPQYTCQNSFMQTNSAVILSLRYRRAPEMIDWLERAFGFRKQAVYMADGNKVAHAQLTFGSGMIMLGSADNGSPTADHMAQPDETGGRVTQSAYLVVSDCDAVYATAKAAGAEIVLDLEEKEYGGKGFTCRDPEGHLWSVGTYDPWADAR